MSERFGLHVCALDAECRGLIGWVWRIEFNTPWWHLGLALRPKNRYERFRRWPPMRESPDLAKAGAVREWVYARRY